MLPYHSAFGNTRFAEAVVFSPRYAGIRRNAAIPAANKEQPAKRKPSVKNFFMLL